MGCDGGTIPRRDELVRMKKKPEQLENCEAYAMPHKFMGFMAIHGTIHGIMDRRQGISSLYSIVVPTFKIFYFDQQAFQQKDKDAERSFKWRNCALSQQPLQEPVVACGLGRLYSKSSVLEALIDKDSKPESINHINNLKDMKDLKLIKNPAYIATEHTEGTVGDSSPYICPISGIEMSGKFRFVFLWSCGCVLAERALKEVRQNLCHVCQTPFTDNDVIVLNGNEEDIEKLKEKMAVRVANRKTSKKSKAEKTKVKIETVTSEEKPSTSNETKTEIKTEEACSSSTVKKEIDTIPLSLPKFNPNHKARGHFGSSKRAFTSTELAQDPSYKKTKKDYSVAKDPQSSEVFKSLFTSHQSEKEQQRAHWVTYNPFYN